MPRRLSNSYSLRLLLIVVAAVFMISCSSQKKVAAPDDISEVQAAAPSGVPIAGESENQKTLPADDQATPAVAEEKSKDAARSKAGDRELDMETCLRIALDESPAYKNAARDVEIAQRNESMAFKGYLPTVQANYAYTHLDNIPMQPGYTIGPYQIPAQQVGTRDNYTLKLSVNQPLFTGFALTSAHRISQLGLDVAQISKDQAKMDLILNVKKAYYGVLKTEKSLEVASQSVKQLQEQLKVAQSFYDVGMVPKNHVLEAEVRLAEAVQGQTVAEHQVIYARAGLNVLLQRDMDTPFQLKDILAYKPFGKPLDECLKTALNTRPEILNSKKQIEMKERQVTLAKADYYPSVAVTYNYQQEGEDWLVDGDEYHDGSAWNVMAAASWKMWEWGKTRDAVQVAQVERRKAKNALVQIQDGVKLEVEESYLSLQAAEKNISVAKKAVEQAEENYRMSQERYREQVATFTEVTDAETLLTNARFQYVNSMVNYNIAWASLERAMGIDPL